MFVFLVCDWTDIKTSSDVQQISDDSAKSTQLEDDHKSSDSSSKPVDGQSEDNVDSSKTTKDFEKLFLDSLVEGMRAALGGQNQAEQPSEFSCALFILFILFHFHFTEHLQ